MSKNNDHTAGNLLDYENFSKHYNYYNYIFIIYNYIIIL